MVVNHTAIYWSVFFTQSSTTVWDQLCPDLLCLQLSIATGGADWNGGPAVFGVSTVIQAKHHCVFVLMTVTCISRWYLMRFILSTRFSVFIATSLYMVVHFLCQLSYSLARSQIHLEKLIEL